MPLRRRIRQRGEYEPHAPPVFAVKRHKSVTIQLLGEVTVGLAYGYNEKQT